MYLIINYWKLIGGIYMGWSLGANDAASVFGTGVATKVIKYKIAILLMSIFVILGALLEGPKCMLIMKDISKIDINTALISSISAALTVTFMIILGIPSSTSQAIMGSIVGGGIYLGSDLNINKLIKVVVCWIFTPLMAAVISYLLYHLFSYILSNYFKGSRAFNFFIKWGLIISGCYGSYSLGANNVANTTGVYFNSGILGAEQASAIGGIAIAFGVLTYSYRIMDTVGNKITQMGPLGAFIVVMANALTVHLFTQIGVPVSSSQAVVGAVIGVGLVRGIKSVSFKILKGIAIGWVTTPLIAGILTWITMSIFY